MGKLGKAFLFLMAVMLLLTAVSRTAASFTVAQVSVEQPQSRKIVHTVTGNGMVEKMKEQPVYAAADVLVAELMVQQGQNVKKGDVLARLDLDSIQKKINDLEDEIEELRLQNQAIAAQQQKEEKDRNKAKARAQEDYNNTVSRNSVLEEEAKKKIEDAKQKVKEAKELAKKQVDDNYKKKIKELREAVDAAQKAYDDAKELEESEVLRAKRAVEDASKTPAVTYDSEISQIEINQKQRKLDELRRQRRECEDNNEKKELDEQIRILEDEITTLKLRKREQENAAGKQEQERKQTLARAQEDYNNTVKKYNKIVSEAKRNWEAAQQELQEFLESDKEDISENTSVKEAEAELEAARQQLKELKRQQKEQSRQAKRTLEDSMEEGVENNMAAINRITITEKQRQLSELEREKENGGKIVAQMDGTITLVQLEVGQRTVETAAFLMSDTSGGMSFTTQISKEDAVYVVAGDTVMLKSADKKYEDFSVLSVETNEDETVKVTVFVPKDTLALGAYACMELTKQSEEYSITVPVSAVHTENEKNFVYVMEEEDTVLGGQYVARRMDVTVAEKNGLYAAVSESSLTAESQVITESDQMISAGEKVRLQEKEGTN